MDDIISRLSEIEDSSQSYIDDAILKKKEIAAEMKDRKPKKSFGSKILMPRRSLELPHYRNL